MDVNPKLLKIDDCLYRVATKALVVQDGKVLMVKEIPEMWWGFPGGGVDYGETLETSMVRELEEELGVPATDISSDFAIAHSTIGTIVDKIPRMNVFFRVTLPKEKLAKTEHIADWAWFSKEEFLKIAMSPSYKDRATLSKVIFGS